MHAWLLTVVAALPAAGPDAPPVEFVPGDHRIDVRIGGQPWTSYIYPDTLPKPSLYPVRTPAGVEISRRYPLSGVKGESTDHPHHVGIFFAYDRVNGNNFWLNTSRSPRIEHIKATAIEGGPGRGRLATVAHWVAKDGTVLLEESRDMVFRAGRDGYRIDSRIDLRAVGPTVHFGDTKEGVFAIRVVDWMREPFQAAPGVVHISGTGDGRYFSSEGGHGEKEIWGRRARWVCLQASHGGKDVGVAIFNHPTSVNYPTYWHARGYGLFAANPLGQGVFEASRHPGKAKPLNLTLEPEHKAHFAFRVLIYDGKRTPAELEREFAAYTK